MEVEQRNTDETICAIATPPGAGGIAVLRLSGSRAKEIAAAVCENPVVIAAMEPNTVRHTYFLDSGERTDEGVVTYFQAPRSYTGEDVVEISCHGGWHGSHTILDALIQQGARLAEPGEFTMRAFLNGKMDLAQAEAVSQLVAARTEAAGKAALRQLEGGLSKRVREMRAKILDMMALIEVELDFSEEDIEFATREERERTLRYLIRDCDTLVQTYRQGRLLREGLRVAIVGPTNSGKSTLFNALVQEQRAIVSPHPGTTRDVIEARLDIRGFEVVLLDTAGVRESSEEVEKEGIARTMKEIERADIILLVIDINENKIEDSSISRTLKGRPKIVVWNKIDLHNDKTVTSTASILPESVSRETVAEVKVSALMHEGLDELKKAIFHHTIGEGKDAAPVQVTEVRHKQELEVASHALNRALSSLKDSTLCATDLRDAADALGRITGETVGEEILERIFSQFCIGK
jgi:tRNA modification GTPase